jgi:hypothetical protein
LHRLSLEGRKPSSHRSRTTSSYSCYCCDMKKKGLLAYVARVVVGKI